MLPQGVLASVLTQATPEYNCLPLGHFLSLLIYFGIVDTLAGVNSTIYLQYSQNTNTVKTSLQVKRAKRLWEQTRKTNKQAKLVVSHKSWGRLDWADDFQ